MQRIMNKKVVSISFIAVISICFYLQNIAVPFFADDYKWIGQWQLKHTGFWADLKQVLQTQWDFCHLENGRLFCHAMVQVLVSWGEPLFDVANSILFPLSCGAVIAMAFDKSHWFRVMPWLMVVIFMRYLIAEETTLLYWACGSMNYLLPTGMTAAVVALLFKYKPNERGFKCWYPFVLLLSLLSGWEHEIIVLPVAFAMLVFLLRNYKEMTLLQWLIIAGYGFGALLVLIAPANFNRINGPIGMAEGKWVAAILKRLYLVVRFGYVFDLLIIYLAYLSYRRWDCLVQFFKVNYFWFCALITVFFMGLVLGTDSRMRWGIDIFSFFILLDFVNKELMCSSKVKQIEAASITIACIVIIHQCALVKPFFESWKTYRDAEQQCIGSKEQVVVRVVDWHNKNWVIDAFVAHPYHMLKEDAFVSLPNSVFDCKAELYDYMKVMTDESYANMPESGLSVSGEYVLPATDNVMKAISENRMLLHLDRMSMQMDYKTAYLYQHILLQTINPSHYPNTTSITTNILHIVEINNHKFICLEKPFCPVWRDINNIEIEDP